MKQLIVLLLLVLPLLGHAQDLVYTPVNPAFGGNYMNYQWLLSSADAQKGEEEESDELLGLFGAEEDPLAQFSESIKSEILSELTSRILEQQFGEFELEQGQYNVGDFRINITDGASGVDIHILDMRTGGETNITIPSY